jgi:hypothetical protein
LKRRTSSSPQVRCAAPPNPPSAHWPKEEESSERKR